MRPNTVRKLTEASSSQLFIGARALGRAKFEKKGCGLFRCLIVPDNRNIQF